MIREINLTAEEICDAIPNATDRKLTRAILGMFLKYGLTYKVRTDGEMLRIYCYIKKSKETLIINTKGYRRGDFDIQLRLTNPASLTGLDRYSDGIREQLLAADNCTKCWNCGKEYVFNYQGQEYRKCCMLCNNFNFHQFNDDDCESVLDMVMSEIRYAIPKQKRHLLEM